MTDQVRRPRPRHALVVGYHRAPPPRRTGAGPSTPASPNGILPTLSSAFADGLPGIWVAGEQGGGRGARGTPDRPGDDRPSAPRARPGEPPLSLVPLSARRWRGYFHRACKETLWPVLMSEPGRSAFDHRSWADYRAVNTRFAEHIAARAAAGATVWLHDYNLWLVPGLLRTARPDLRVGLFHHTPFPAPETFAALPVAGELRSSLARLDWAGFHTAEFAEHFRGMFGAAGDAPVLPPRIGVHPLGIDRPAIEAIARSRPRPSRPERPAPTDGRIVVLSVERLDYAKAPVQKVDAVDRLLAARPDLRGRLTFRLVCPPPEPGITAYDSTRARLEERVAAVNDAWRRGGWQPVDYRPGRLPFPEVVGAYLAADVFWVTSLQDGMNLTAKEFVAARTAAPRPGPRGPGVLVLSRHAGAAATFGAAALLTDPRSPGDLSATLARALDLTPAERGSRMARLSALLGRERPVDWALGIVDAIRRSRPPGPDG